MLLYCIEGKSNQKKSAQGSDKTLCSKRSRRTRPAQGFFLTKVLCTVLSGQGLPHKARILRTSLSAQDRAQASHNGAATCQKTLVCIALFWGTPKAENGPGVPRASAGTWTRLRTRPRIRLHGNPPGKSLKVIGNPKKDN